MATFLIGSKPSAPPAYSAQAVRFNGVDEHLQIVNPGFNATRHGGRTVSFFIKFLSWVNATPGVNSTDIFMGFGNNDVHANLPLFLFDARARTTYSGIRLGLVHRTDLNGAFSGTHGIYGSTELALNTWYHVMYTTTGVGGNKAIIVNGVAETVNTWTGSNTDDWAGDMNMTSPVTFSLGRNYQSGAAISGSNCIIDEMTWWNGSVWASEAAQLRDGSGKPLAPPATMPGSGATLQVHYRLGENWTGSVFPGSVPGFDLVPVNMDASNIVTDVP